MPKFVLKSKDGRVLDHVEAASHADALKLYKTKKASIPAVKSEQSSSFLNDAWDWANKSFLPEYHLNTGNKIVDKVGDFAYENLVRPTASPLGIAAEGAWLLRPAGFAFKAARAGLQTPVNAIATSAAKPKVLRRIVDETKQFALTSGIPGTNISFHGISMAAANAMATPLKEGGIIKGALQSARALVDQKYVKRELAKLAGEDFKVLGQTLYKGVPTKGVKGVVRTPVTLAEAAKKAGVVLDLPGQAGARTQAPLLTAGKYNPLRVLRNVQEEVFDKPLFEEMVPMFKLQQFKRNLSEMEKVIKPATKKEYWKLGKEAATSANNFFGGLGKGSRWDKEALKPLLLAPDWYERHVKMGTKIFQSLTNPRDPMGKTYRTFASNMAQTLGVMDVANKALSGKHLWQNEGGKFFSIDTGRVDEAGRRVYFDPTAGALDFAKLPTDVIHSMVKEKDMAAAINPILNRLSTVARAVTDMAGMNYKPKVSRYQFPKRERQKDGSIKVTTKPPVGKQLEFIGEDILDNMSPGWMQAAEDAFHGGERDQLTSKSQKVAKSLELPFRFAKDRRPDVMSKAEARQTAKDRSRARKIKKREDRKLKFATKN